MEKMQEELIELQPQLVESTKETEAAMEVNWRAVKLFCLQLCKWTVQKK